MVVAGVQTSIKCLVTHNHHDVTEQLAQIKKPEVMFEYEDSQYCTFQFQGQMAPTGQ